MLENYVFLLLFGVCMFAYIGSRIAYHLFNWGFYIWMGNLVGSVVGFLILYMSPINYSVIAMITSGIVAIITMYVQEKTMNSVSSHGHSSTSGESKTSKYENSAERFSLEHRLRNDRMNDEMKQVASGNMWRCSKCGRVNANYVTTCVCSGKRNDQEDNSKESLYKLLTDDEKREIQKAEYKMKTHEIEAYEFESIEAKYLANAQKREQQVLQGNAWICSKCQRINMAYVTSCPCGKNRNS
jgi:hypothetical protein